MKREKKKKNRKIIEAKARTFATPYTLGRIHDYAFEISNHPRYTPHRKLAGEHNNKLYDPGVILERGQHGFNITNWET